MIDFEFDKLEEGPEDNDGRSNYRITRCCGNCKFFWYYGNSQRKGNCRLGHPLGQKKSYKGSFRRTDKHNKTLWKPTHITCVCEKHQFRSRVTSIAKVTDYCGAKLDEGI